MNPGIESPLASTVLQVLVHSSESTVGGLMEFSGEDSVQLALINCVIDCLRLLAILGVLSRLEFT